MGPEGAGEDADAGCAVIGTKASAKEIAKTSLRSAIKSVPQSVSKPVAK